MPEPVTLEELKLFARIDHDDDDDVLTSLGVAAREFVERATGRCYTGEEAEEVPQLARIAIASLASYWFDNREPAADRATGTLPFHVRTMVHQLTDWTRIEADQAAEA